MAIYGTFKLKSPQEVGEFLKVPMKKNTCPYFPDKGADTFSIVEFEYSVVLYVTLACNIDHVSVLF